MTWQSAEAKQPFQADPRHMGQVLGVLLYQVSSIHLDERHHKWHQFMGLSKIPHQPRVL